jgi:hypothetical protein
MAASMEGVGGTALTREQFVQQGKGKTGSLLMGQAFTVIIQKFGSGGVFSEDTVLKYIYDNKNEPDVKAIYEKFIGAISEKPPAVAKEVNEVAKKSKPAWERGEVKEVKQDFEGRSQMLHIVGAYKSEFSFCDQPVQCLLQKEKRMYKMLNLSESQQSDSPENRKIFLTYLKRTNKVCSPLFAAFVPVKSGRLSDVFSPISTNYIKKLSSDAGNKARIWNAVRSIGAVLTDAVTLPVRLITFLPRVLVEILRPCPMKIWHPIKYLAETDDGQNPCIVVSDKEKFFFSLAPIHESEAKKYFDKRVSQLSNSS